MGWSAALAAILLLTAFTLFSFHRPAIVGPDDGGYYPQGTLLAATGSQLYQLDSPIQYVGRHWLRTPDGHLVSRYSPGMAYVVAAITRVAGHRASVALNIVLSIAWLAAFYAFARRVVGVRWGVFAALALAVTPPFLGQGLLGGSHHATGFLLCGGLAFLLSWRERGGAWRGIAAGLFLGAIPLFRPSEIVLGLGISLLVLSPVVRGERHWRDALVVVAAAVLAMLPLLVYNYTTFAAPWRTAYDITGEQSAFELSRIPLHLRFYTKALLLNGLGVLAPLAPLGIVVLLLQKRTREIGVAFALLGGAAFFLYLTYYFLPVSRPAVSTRFLLPVLPIAIVTALYFAREMISRMPGPTRRWGVAILVAAHVIWGIRQDRAMLAQYAGYKDVVVSLEDALLETAPAGSVVATMFEPMQVEMMFTRRWKVADRALSLPLRINDVLDGAAPGSLLGMQRNKRRAQLDRFNGLSAFQRDSLFATDTEQWAKGLPVLMLATRADFDNATSSLTARDRFDVLAMVSVADPDAEESPAPRIEYVVATWHPWREIKHAAQP